MTMAIPPEDPAAPAPPSFIGKGAGGLGPVLDQVDPATEDLPPGFKPTPLGPLPEEWDVVRLGTIATTRYGKAKPSDAGTVPVVGSGGTYGWAAKALVDFPTLVVGRKGTAGMVWLQERPFWPSDTTFYLDWQDERIDYRFIYHCLQQRPLSGEHAKTTLPSLQKPDLDNYLLPLPPLPEQRAIAQVLRTVQRAREATEAVIAATRELKKSLLRHLFTYGPVPVDQAEQVPLKETEIGPVPEHWRVLPLGDVLTLQRGYDLPHQERAAGRVPVVSSSGPSGWHSVAKVKAPGVVIGRYGTLGKVFYIEEDFWPLNTTLFVKQFKGADPSFAALLLGTLDYQAQNDKTSVPGVNRNDLHMLTVPLPPAVEQGKIVLACSAVDRRLEAEEQRKAALESLFKALLQELMTGRMRAIAQAIE